MFEKKSRATPDDLDAFARQTERFGFEQESLSYSILPSETSGANHFVGIGRHVAGVDAAYCLEICEGVMRDGVILGPAAVASYRASVNDARMSGRGLIQHFRMMADRNPERFGPDGAVIRFLIDAAAAEERERDPDIHASARIFTESMKDIFDRFDEGELSAAELRRDLFWRLSVTIEIGVEKYREGKISADQLIEWVRATYADEI